MKISDPPDSVSNSRSRRSIFRRILTITILLIYIPLALIAFVALIVIVPLPEFLKTPSVTLLILTLDACFLVIWRRIGGWRRTGSVIVGALTAVVTVLLPLTVVAIPIGPAPQLQPRPQHSMITTDKYGNQVAVYTLATTDPITSTPLVFVNGGPGDAVSNNTLDFLSGFADRGLPTFAYDQLGTGASTTSNDPVRDYTMANEVDRLRKVVDFTGAGKVVLMAHSFGGNIVSRYLAKYPETVAKYVQVDTAPLYSMSGNTKEQAEAPSPTDTNPKEADSKSTAAPQMGKDLRENLRTTLMLWALDATGRLPYGGPHELDSPFDAVANEAMNQSSTLCTGDPVLPAVGEPSTNLAVVPLIDLNKDLNNSSDTTGKLWNATGSIPVLRFHPECGLIPWDIAYESAKFFPKFSVVAVPGAHHRVWGTQRGRDSLYRDTASFVTDTPVQDLWTKATDPFRS